jgi:hypothetical protein
VSVGFYFATQSTTTPEPVPALASVPTPINNLVRMVWQDFEIKRRSMDGMVMDSGK